MKFINQSRVDMDLHRWRGYSAYEIAVQNGFEGTEAMWLNSLRGKDGLTTSVNGYKPDASGAIVLLGGDIALSESDSRTIRDVADAADTIASLLNPSDDGFDLKGKYIDNALFR